MAQNTLNDNSTGDVVITPGSSASSGGGGGFFSLGGGGGFGGGFGGSSRRRRKNEPERAAALARARAEEQARQAAAAAAHAELLALAHRQQVAAYGQARETRRAQLDAHFAGRMQGLAQALQEEINAVRRPPKSDGRERWQLYLITKARNETIDLIAAKQLDLARQQAFAKAFAGPDMTAEAYANLVSNLSSTVQMQQLHRDWEAAYVATQEARLLSEAIGQLEQRAAALATEHAQQQVHWRALEARWEREHQYAEQREARVRHKQQADQDRRLQRLRQAATVTAPVSAAQAGGVLLSQAGAQVAADLAAAIEQAIASAAKEVLRVAAIRLGQAVSLTATAMLYAPALGDGELTAAQRRRHLEGLGVRADLMGIAAGQDLQSIADAGGSARLDNRIKIEHLAGGSAIAVASTGSGIAADVRVRNALFDPLTETYRVNAETPTGKSIVLGSTAVSEESPPGGRVLTLAPQTTEVGAGVDLRFDDCIVCIPGQPAQYFSFALPTAGTGIVSGKGVAADANWWSVGGAAAGVGLPEQVADQLRNRVFTAMPAFESAVWRAVAADQVLLGQFDELNQRRILNGFPPVAPKASWAGSRSEFELRHLAAAGVGSGLYDLDQLSIHSPGSTQGVLTVVQPFEPWFASGVALAFDAGIVQGQPPRTWTPLVAPGAQMLGSTLLPVAPALPDILPGSPTDPLGPSIEILPGENPGETGAIIPGFGGEGNLPEPGLVNNEPAEITETGVYGDLERRSIRDDMDVDHIPAQGAIKLWVDDIMPDLSPYQLRALLRQAPAVVIPTEVHRKHSETYGGRNTKAKQALDAADLFAAVASNVEALRPGLPPERVEGVKAELTSLLKDFIKRVNP
ncbi:S-type pyocin domain-containing protein [Pseudomonas sp. SWRI59]|uniref:S-type pyocin domain-containing protein n=1 Tax=unclassified Pseudomonas TaxID=196821 RepID=UPI001647F276|nr:MULTISPECIES: S-type pyocin domain-containing protein [unclassified Pseudomonas]MBC3501033.1 S-type pyocin domain-containing protein [Pseudomonas sp. SWRI59]MBC3507338.1 S-type pyocin domain-containing protein [Pseudomonas sp. SWRI68]